MRLALLRLLQHPPALMFVQPASDGSGLLRSQVERQVLLVLVEQPQLRALVGVYDGEDFGDGFAEVVAGRSVRDEAWRYW